MGFGVRLGCSSGRHADYCRRTCGVRRMKNKIRELRRARGLRQEDLAQMLGVSRQTVVAMENDKYDPSLALAMRVARLLETTVEELFLLEE